MADFRIPNYHSTLKDEPKLAQLLGVYVSTFARIELSTLNLFCTLTGACEEAGHVIMHQLLNFSGRIAMLEDLLAGVRHPRKAELQTLISDIKAENGQRNILAHGIYADDFKGNVIVVSNATKARQKPKTYPVTTESLTERCAQAEAILERLGKFEAHKTASNAPNTNSTGIG